MKAKLTHKKNIRKEKGITLVALVVTIVVLLILAGITITLVFSENGIIEKAKDAGDVTKKVDIIEDIQLDILEKEIENSGEGISLSELEEILDKHSEKVNKDEDGNITSIEVEGLSNPIDIKEIYTGKLRSEETVDIKTILQVGDFIDYDAGTWTEDQIEALNDVGLYAGEDLPGQFTPYRFGSFKEGSDRNESINNNMLLNTDLSGWRVLNIEDDGTIKIVHAGIPESYYHSGATNSAYKTQYILEGKININGTDAWDYSSIAKRDWKMYENGSLVVEGSAHCMTYDEAYNITGSNAPSDLTIRNIGTMYYTPSISEPKSTTLYSVGPNGVIAYYYGTMGIRPVVSLKSGLTIVSGSGLDTDPYVLK